LCENMKPYDIPEREQYQLKAEDISMAIGKAFVDWCMERRAVKRDRHNNLPTTEETE